MDFKRANKRVDELISQGEPVMPGEVEITRVSNKTPVINEYEFTNESALILGVGALGIILTVALTLVYIFEEKPPAEQIHSLGSSAKMTLPGEKRRGSSECEALPRIKVEVKRLEAICTAED